MSLPVNFECERKVKAFHVLHPCLVTSGVVRLSRLQQLLRQPISCFLKLDVTVNNQHCPHPFSQHQAMMGSVFPQGSGSGPRLQIYAI